MIQVGQEGAWEIKTNQKQKEFFPIESGLEISPPQNNCKSGKNLRIGGLLQNGKVKGEGGSG